MDSKCEDFEVMNQSYHTDFYGRKTEMEWFFDNLCLDASDSSRKTIVNVFGISGIGKSYLLDEMKAGSAKLGFITTRISKDITSPLDALYSTACQLSEKGLSFTKYVDRYDQFLRRRGELAKLSDLRIEEFVGEVADEVIKANPPSGADPFTWNPPPIGGSVAKIFGTIRKNKQVRLQRDEDLYPVKTFSGLFLNNTGENLVDHSWICFIDGFDQTRDILENWLAQLLGGEYGELSSRHLVIIASQKPLDRNIWANLLTKIHWMELPVFSFPEVEGFLQKTGITDPQLIQSIAERTGGLPLDISNVASQQPQSMDDLKRLSEDQYDHFFGLFSNSKQKEIATHAALARRIDQDVLAALLDTQESSAEVFDWLRTKTSFLNKLPDERGWEYHDLIRTAAINFIHARSQKTWKNVHQTLARYYQDQRETLGIKHEDGLNNSEYQAYALEFLYHSFCAQPTLNQALAINTVVEAMRVNGDFDLRCAMAFQQGEEDSLILSNDRWGDTLVNGLLASYERKDLQKSVEMCDRILIYPELEPKLLGLLYYWRGATHFHMGNFESTIADLTRAIELEPSNAKYYDLRVASYLETCQYNQAIADGTRAIDLEASEARYYQLRGVSYHAAGQYKDAVRDFTSAIELEPSDVKYYRSRGLTYHEDRKYKEAIADFTRTIDLEPGEAEYYQLRGVSYHLAGQYKEAIRDFTSATELEPSDVKWRGLTYFANQQYKEAIADLTRAIELEPGEAENYQLRGVSYHAAGHYKEAIGDFTYAIGLQPGNAEYYYSRGASYCDTGNYKEAIADGTRAIELEPGNADYYYSRGTSYYDTGNYKEAIADGTRAIELEPGNADYYYSRGASYYETGNYKEAIADCTRAIELEPGNAKYYISRAASYHKESQYKEAITDCIRAIELDPGNSECYISRGASYFEDKRYKEAIADCTRAIELEPGNAEYYNSRGASYHAEGQYKMAIADYTGAIDLEPDNAKYYYSRGASYYAAGYYKDAIADCTSAIELVSVNAEYYYSRGFSYHAEGQYKMAIADYTNAIDLEPDNAEYYYSRGASYHAEGQYKRAIADCTRAIKLDRDNAKYYYSRGASYYAAGHHKHAIADCTYAIVLEPDNGEYYILRGFSYHEAGLNKESIVDFTNAIDLEPDNPSWYEHRAFVIDVVGMSDLAEADRAYAKNLRKKSK